MSAITVALELPAEIARELALGNYERVGGVIRNAKTKEIVAWLREVVHDGEPDIAEALNLLGSTSSMMNLAVSTMGFAVVMKRLGAIQQRLEEAQESLRSIECKVDLSFYGNLCAALDLAANAFTMTKAENRKASAMQAVNRFLEAERHYAHLVDLELEQGSRVADDYLLTLALGYVTEVRCYLELEELGTAHRRLQDGLLELRPRFEQLVKMLLTENPAAYLHPALQGHVDLRRLTQVYQWLQPGLDENAVFEDQREKLFALAQHPQDWVDALPPAFLTIKRSRFSRLRDVLPPLSRKIPGRTVKEDELDQDLAAVLGALPETLLLIEQLIESERRFQMYGAEVEAARQLGMTFRDWVELTTPFRERADDTGLRYLLPAEPIKLAA